MTEGELPAADPGEWFVMFCDADTDGWWRGLCRPGFEHVMAFAYSSSAKRWLVYDVARDRTYVRAYTPADFDGWLANLPQERTVLRWQTPPLERQPHMRLGFWCTIAIKHLVGVRSRALRPQALYRDLVRQGARRAFEAGHETAIPRVPGAARGQGRQHTGQEPEDGRHPVWA